MELSHILTLVGGLALFLLGMNSMGDGLEQACGNKMKSILKKLTSNRFIGVFVGAIITAIIQSSSATTVMVVGFVNAVMMLISVISNPFKNFFTILFSIFTIITYLIFTFIDKAAANPLPQWYLFFKFIYLL